jgi:hypothetical protein
VLCLNQRLLFVPSLAVAIVGLLVLSGFAVARRWPLT